MISFAPTVRGSRPGKYAQLPEAEIRYLCLKAREIFLTQPILLELEAPLKLCGERVYPSTASWHLVMDGGV